MNTLVTFIFFSFLLYFDQSIHLALLMAGFFFFLAKLFTDSKHG